MKPDREEIQAWLEHPVTKLLMSECGLRAMGETNACAWAPSMEVKEFHKGRMTAYLDVGHNLANIVGLQETADAEDRQDEGR